MDDFFSPDAAPPGTRETIPQIAIFTSIAENVAQVEEIEIIPDQAAGAPVDLSAEFAELNDAAPVMQEGTRLYI